MHYKWKDPLKKKRKTQKQTLSVKLNRAKEWHTIRQVSDNGCFIKISIAACAWFAVGETPHWSAAFELSYRYPRLDARGGIPYTWTFGFTQSIDS